jgi:signal peptidase I
MRLIPRSLSILRGWIRFVAATLALFLVLRVFALDAYIIPTSSMEKTLLVGDYLFVNKLIFGAEIPGTHVSLPAIRDPRRGEVVVFRPPHDPHRSYVKRVVGIPGDTLEMKGKVLYLNGVPQDESYARHVDRRGDAIHPSMAWQSDHLVAAHPRHHYTPTRDTWGPLVVPRGDYFVLGDNRDNSEDSRYWGFVGREEIRGRPWIVYLSVDQSVEGVLRQVRWGRVGHRVK